MDTPVEYFYHGALRWGFGFESPNKAAVVFACLLPLLWCGWQLAWTVRRPLWRRLLLALASALILLTVFCLCQTYSRGGVVAALGGMAYVWWVHRRLPAQAAGREFRQRRWLGGAVCGLALILAGGVSLRAWAAVAHADASVTHRLGVWRAALQMASEHPAGFGAGQSGAMYMQWYQPLERNEAYRTLVNSYLTFLVERGWLIFLGALLAAALLWVWTRPKTNGQGKSLAVAGLRGGLVAFALGGLFSTVMEEPLLWILPGLCASALILWTLWARSTCPPRRMLGAGAVALGLAATGWLGGWVIATSDPLRRTFADDRVLVEPRRPPSGPALWCCATDPSIMGPLPGRLVRQWAQAAGIAARVADAAPCSEKLAGEMLAGTTVAQASNLHSSVLVLLAPVEISEAAAAALLASAPQVLLFLPDIDEDGRAEFWQHAVSKAPHPQKIRVVTLPGVGLRLDWAWPKVLQILTATTNIVSPGR
jgi:hypothetical protein